MRKKIVILLVVVAMLSLLISCSETKKIEELSLEFKNGNYTAVQEIHEKIRQDESLIEANTIIGDEIRDTIQGFVKDEEYQEAYEYAENILLNLEPYKTLAEDEIADLIDLVNELSQKVYDESFAQWNFLDAIESQNDLLEKAAFMKDKIEERIFKLQSLNQGIGFYLDAVDLAENNNFTEALDQLLLEKDVNSELTDSFNDEINNVKSLFFDYTTEQIISSIRNNKIAEIKTIIADYEKYDEDGAETLRSNTEELVPDTVNALKEEGKYAEAIEALESIKKELSFMSAFADSETSAITTLLPSMESYFDGLEQLEDSNYASSLSYFKMVSAEAAYYYTLAMEKTELANTEIYSSYIATAKENFRQREFDSAIAAIDTALTYKHTDEAVDLRDAYAAEKALYKEPHEIFAMNSKAVVLITTYDDSLQEQGQGSGFIIASNGKIITNYHVIKSAYKAKVKLSDGTEYDVTQVLKYDTVQDFAIIKIEASGLSTIKLGDSDDLWSGERIVAIGNPKGMENTISEGLVSSKERVVSGVEYMQISAPISPGSSGGVLCNMKGEAVGITTAYILDAQNLNLAVAINLVKPFISNTTSQMSFDAFADRTDYEVIIYHDSLTYEGDTKRGIPNGTGTFTYEDYYIYTGDVVNGIFEGNGKMEFRLGAVYEGEFHDDMFHGQGKFTYSNGGVAEGIYENGYFVGEAENIPQNLRGYIPSGTDKINVAWDSGNFDSYHVYYSYDMITWHAVGSGGTPTDFRTTETEFTIPKSEVFVYVGVTGVKNGVESKKSQYKIFFTLFEKLAVYSNDGKNVFLGELSTDENNPNSIFFDGVYASFSSANSIWNENSLYGSETSDYSAFNYYAQNPPVVKNSKGEIIGYLTINDDFQYGDISLISLFPDIYNLIFITTGIGL